MWKRRGRRIARSLKAGRCQKPLRQGQAVEADASILSSWPPAASLPVVVVDWAVTVRPVVRHRRLAAEDLVAAKRMPNWTSSAALAESAKAPAM